MRKYVPCKHLYTIYIHHIKVSIQTNILRVGLHHGRWPFSMVRLDGLTPMDGMVKYTKLWWATLKTTSSTLHSNTSPLLDMFYHINISKLIHNIACTQVVLRTTIQTQHRNTLLAREYIIHIMIFILQKDSMDYPTYYVRNSTLYSLASPPQKLVTKHIHSCRQPQHHISR